MSNKFLLLMVLPSLLLILVIYAPVMYHTFIAGEPIYGEWSEWFSCMNSCGPSWQGRNRNCSTENSMFGKPCVYKEKFETRPCNLMECPIDGRAGEWSEWQTCKIECKDSTRERVRYCNNPAPKHNGLNCFESMQDVKACPSDKMCPIDGYYKTADWGECSVTCGGGVRQKPHPCEPPQYGGKPCNPDEAKEETSTCNENACPTTTTTTTTTTKAPTTKQETAKGKIPPAT